MLFSALRFVLFALVLCTSGALPALAATFEVYPVNFSFTPASRVGVFTIKNDGDAALSLAAHVCAWSQHDDNDVLTPADDLILTPATFRIPAHGSRIVRLLPRGPIDLTHEHGFRLIFEELQSEVAGASAIGMPVSISIPVFANSGTGEASLSYEVRATQKGLALKVSNSGSIHARLGPFSVAKAGRVLVQTSLSTDLFPGQTRSYELPLNEHVATGTTLSLQLDGADAAVTVR